MSLHFNYSSMLAEKIGGQGITRTELNQLAPLFHAILSDLTERREAGDLPFYDLPFDRPLIEQINSFTVRAREHFENYVLLGIGGSALGPIALHAALNHPQYNLLPQRPGCRFFCPDNVDPDYVGAVLDVVDPAATLFNVVSKSGGTAETAAQFLLILDVLKRRLGAEWRGNLVLTTDPDQGLLRRFAGSEGITAFPIHPKVGGRYSVMTPVGLLPAAMVGIDIDNLCRGAGAMKAICLHAVWEENPAALIGGLLYRMQAKGCPIHVMFAYSNRLYPIADWFRQLWAESLGKRFSVEGEEIFTGPTPVKAIGATDQHSQVQLYVEGPLDKVFLMLGTREFGRKLPIPAADIDAAEVNYLKGADMGDLLNAERRATTYALTQAGRPNMTLELDRVDAAHVGAVMYLLEAATLFAGGFYRVNPLDQPGVEAGKKATYALMGRSGYERQKYEIDQFYGAGVKELTLPI